MPVDAAALLDMRAVAGITDYDPDELVLTARAGTPLTEIEAALGERQQMLAFEPFDHAPLFGELPGGATLGGIIAGNVSGSRRLSMGAARDHILGFTAVSGRGEALKGGGAVVKNVTGFDLPKLMAGSWGTLAVLITITMRVLPRPRTETTALFRGLSDQAANRLMSAALALPAAVSAAAHLPSSRAAASYATTALRLEGFGPSVDARCRELLRALAPLGAGEVVTGEESRAFWRERAHARCAASRGACAVENIGAARVRLAGGRVARIERCALCVRLGGRTGVGGGCRDRAARRRPAPAARRRRAPGFAPSSVPSAVTPCWFARRRRCAKRCGRPNRPLRVPIRA